MVGDTVLVGGGDDAVESQEGEERTVAGFGGDIIVLDAPLDDAHTAGAPVGVLAVVGDAGLLCCPTSSGVELACCEGAPPPAPGPPAPGAAEDGDGAGSAMLVVGIVIGGALAGVVACVSRNQRHQIMQSIRWSTRSKRRPKPDAPGAISFHDDKVRAEQYGVAAGVASADSAVPIDSAGAADALARAADAAREGDVLAIEDRTATPSTKHGGDLLHMTRPNAAPGAEAAVAAAAVEASSSASIVTRRGPMSPQDNTEGGTEALPPPATVGGPESPPSTPPDGSMEEATETTTTITTTTIVTKKSMRKRRGTRMTTRKKSIRRKHTSTVSELEQAIAAEEDPEKQKDLEKQLQKEARRAAVRNVVTRKRTLVPAAEAASEWGSVE